MACACKVNRDLSYLQKRFGVDKETKGSKKSDIRGDVRKFMRKLIIFILSIPVIPIFLISIIWRSFFKKEKAINIAKVFRLGNVGK